MKLDNPTLLGIAALITAIGGVISTIVGARRARREERDRAEQECRERLKSARQEAEETAAELHALKMEKFDKGRNDDQG